MKRPTIDPTGRPRSCDIHGRVAKYFWYRRQLHDNWSPNNFNNAPEIQRLGKGQRNSERKED